MVSDVDGTQENRRGTVSLFDGPAPVIRLFKNAAAEGTAVGAWIAERLREGLRGRPPGVAGGIKPSSRAHCASLRSLGKTPPDWQYVARCSFVHILCHHAVVDLQGESRNTEPGQGLLGQAMIFERTAAVRQEIELSDCPNLPCHLLIVPER
jgi:hypothetical protein